MPTAPDRALRRAQHVMAVAPIQRDRTERIHRKQRLPYGAATQDAKVAGLAAARPHAATGILKIQG